MTSDDVIVTAILLAICVAVMAIIGSICRILGNYQSRVSPSTPFARCRGRFESCENAAAESLQPSRRPVGDGRDDPRTTIGARSVQEEVGENESERESSRSNQGRIDASIENYPPDAKNDLEGVQRWSRRNEPSACHDVVEVVEDGALAPPIGASAVLPPLAPLRGDDDLALASPISASAALPSLTDDVVLQAIINGCVSSSSVEAQSVTGLTGGLQRALSCDSVMSDTSAADVDVTMTDANKIGQLEFGLNYDSGLSDLVVNVIQARDLERNPVTGSQDSYVKLWVTPHHDDRKNQTKTQRNSVNPEYSERFRFRVVADQLDESCVQFQVYSCDRYARQKLLGETEVRLGDVDLRQPVRVWMNLHDMDQRPVSFGDIMFSMAYLPTAERLTVVIAKARNLQCPVAKQSTDCFAKVHILQKGKKVAKKKTSKKYDARNPIFNEAMTFSVPTSSLLSVQLRISVYTIPSDRGGGGAGQGGEAASDIYPVGHVTLGPKSGGMELVHWTQTMTSLRKPVTMWHSLGRD